MKIRVVETEIVADAEEIKESRTLAESISEAIKRGFQGIWRSDYEEEGEQDEDQ